MQVRCYRNKSGSQKGRSGNQLFFSYLFFFKLLLQVIPFQVASEAMLGKEDDQEVLQVHHKVN